MPNLDEAKRAYYYRISLAVLALAVVFKLFGPDKTEGVSELLAAIFGIGSAGLATKNTSTKG